MASDSSGSVILSACTPLYNCQDAEEAEARAALWGLKLLANRSQGNVILELDCSNAVAALQENNQDMSRLWTVYQEAKALFRNFNECSIRHAKRETNRVANYLAKLALLLGERI